MTKFLDGPAAGRTLMLRRAPIFLRVVRNAAGEWDALDQLDDQPAEDENVVVYRLVRGPWTAHVNMGRKGCGWFQGAEYRVLAQAEQPPYPVVRSLAAWRAWALDADQRHVGAELAAK